MISLRFAPAACVIVLAALVPTIIHSYAGVVVEDGRSTAAIPVTLGVFTGQPTARDPNWGQRWFQSEDWIERRYMSGSDQVTLTVLRSYDLKTLYHHPELMVAYGAGYLKEEIVSLQDLPNVPVHLLSTGLEAGGTAMYVLQYDDRFVANPLWFQVQVAGELLFGGRKPMTLLFARDVTGRKGATPDSYPSAQVLRAALQQFAGTGVQTSRGE